MKCFEYARCLVEISSEKELPDFISVGDQHCDNVLMEYSWHPLICTHCKVFGHYTLNYDFFTRSMDGTVNWKSDTCDTGTVKVNKKKEVGKLNVKLLTLILIMLR